MTSIKLYVVVFFKARMMLFNVIHGNFNLNVICLIDHLFDWLFLLLKAVIYSFTLYAICLHDLGVTLLLEERWGLVGTFNRS
jgi:hypothetical protein